MNNKKVTTWHDIWVKRGNAVNVDKKETQQLLDLIKLDGFDSGGGVMTENFWLDLIDLTCKKIHFKDCSNLIEIGCGAGAFLYPFYSRGGLNIIGVDYSEPLLKIAREAMPKAHFICAEANSLSFNKDCFDIAISNSIFHYFPDYKYANEVLLEIVRVLRPGGEGLILDINDLSKREYAENKRRENLGVEEYEKRYKDLPQMYYNKEWFEEFALKNNLEFEIFDQNIVGYDNSEWRFNFYFKKN